MIQVKTKLVKTEVLDAILYTLNFTTLLGDDLIANITSLTVRDNTLSVDDSYVTSAEVTVSGTTIAAGAAVQILLSGGVANTEYRIDLSVLTTGGNVIDVAYILLVAKGNLDYYGSLHYADEYFQYSLHAAAWRDAEVETKMGALIAASRAIDRLNYDGSKYSATQRMQFPRGTNVEVPEDVERACYEEALALIDGSDAQQEQTNLGVISQGFASVRTTYDRTSVPENVLAGIVSHAAWAYLVPYLRDPGEIIISRV